MAEAITRCTCIRQTSKHEFQSLKEAVKVRSSSADKTIKVAAQRNVCAQTLMLCHEHNIDVQRVFSYPMGPIPWALASSDGTIANTNKAVLMHKLESNITTNETYDMITSDFVYIVDGNVLFHFVENVYLKPLACLLRLCFTCCQHLMKSTLLQILTRMYEYNHSKGIVVVILTHSTSKVLRLKCQNIFINFFFQTQTRNNWFNCYYLNGLLTNMLLI